MGRKLDKLLGRTSRQMEELKSLLNLAVSRLAVLHNRRQARCDQANADVAQLLQLGHVDRALLRVEHVIKEQNMLDVFAMLEHYCLILSERAVLLEYTQCPEELREATASLIFAASRCAELPELEKMRGIFSSKYGKEFVRAAVELRNDCGVNTKMIQKLSTRQPDLEIRQRVTKEIAAGKGIKLNFFDPSETTDVTNGDSFANQMQLESGENTPMRSHGQKKYKDVAGAAQAAFESAALAAAAARAAVELCRSESQGKGSDDEAKAGSRKRSEVEESKTDVVEATDDNKNFEADHNQNIDSDSEEETTRAKQNDSLQKEKISGRFVKQLRKTSDSESSEEEDNMTSSKQYSAGFRGKDILFDKSDDDRGGSKREYNKNEHDVQKKNQFNAPLGEGPPRWHRSSYLRPPYRRRNETGCDEKSNPLREEISTVGLRSGKEANSTFYYTAENTCQDSTENIHLPNLSSGKKPISLRTRRGH